MKLKGDFPISYHFDLIIKKKKNKKDIPNLRFILHHLLFFFSLIAISFLLLISSHQTKEIDELFSILYPIQTKSIELHTMVSQLQKEIDNQKKSLQNKINTYNKSNQSFEDFQSVHKELYQTNVRLQSKMSVNNVLSQSKIFTNREDLDEVDSYVKKVLHNDSTVIKLLYQSSREEHRYLNFIDTIKNKNNIMIIIKTEGKESFRFGGFISNTIENQPHTEQYDDNAFLFSLDFKEMFPINHGEVAYWFTQETFCFGSCDIMIGIHGQSGLDLFPRSYGDLTKTINDSLFTLGESEFLIKELEVFEFVNKEY